MGALQSGQLGWTSRRTAAHGNQLGLPTYMLAFLVTSYFYCLPLGRYAIVAVQTDYRLYDFVFLAFMGVVGLGKLKEMRLLWQQQDGFFRWALIMLYLVWMSLGMVELIGNQAPATMLSTMLRAFRFTNYLLIGAFIIIIVDSHEKFRFLLSVIFANIALQALLAFAQGLGWLGTFWPSYWTESYNAKHLPVATLSPHHLQISIVMLLGIGLSISLLFYIKDPFLKGLLVVLMAIMMSVPVMAGTRTAWFSVIGIIAVYLYLYRTKGIVSAVLIGLCIYMLFTMSQNVILEPMQRQIDVRITNRLELGGVEAIYGGRETVYDNAFANLGNNPWPLIFGTGFQNIDIALEGATGAHNNYLQVWLELGILGLIVFLTFLAKIWRQLRDAIDRAPGGLERAVAQGAWMAYAAVLISMFAGETMWAQYSMFTLTGQIMAVMALAIAPLYWEEPPQSKVQIHS